MKKISDKEKVDLVKELGEALSRKLSEDSKLSPFIRIEKGFLEELAKQIRRLRYSEMLHIAYQNYDDAAFASFHSMEELKTFMKKNDIPPDCMWLVKGGEMISGMGNKHMPKEFYK